MGQARKEVDAKWNGAKALTGEAIRDSVPPGNALAGVEHARPTPVAATGLANIAIQELCLAILHTVEYVGLDVLPPIPGWSWYDALRKYRPDMLTDMGIDYE